jgi:hypothetical protein
MSSHQQNWRKEQSMFCLEVRGGWEKREGGGGQGGQMAQTMYVHVNKLIKNV